MNERKSLTIRMEEELHKKVKIKAVMENQSIQDYILNLVKKDLEKEEAK